MRSFAYTGSPARILFGAGRSAEVGAAVDALGCRRALVLATPHQKADAEALSVRLGPLSVGVFAGAVMHTPVAVTETALKIVRETEADCVVSLGGGSTTQICRRS
jgi:maleylacetate reductase